MQYKVQITKETREQDLIQDFNTIVDAGIFISQNIESNDGYRIIEFSNPALSTLREGSKAQLNVITETEFSTTLYDTLAEAQTAIDNLNDSDGYTLIDLEQPVGSVPSHIIKHKPSLWITEEESYHALRENSWNRTDNDRI